MKNAERAILDTLIDYHIMNEKDKEKFSNHLLINIKKQAANIDGLITYKSSEEITYTFLSKSDDYNKYRASRTFLYMGAPGEFGSTKRIDFLKQLSLKIKDKKNNSIIESFCEGENEIIIETFSSCAQTGFINHLHKSIEKCLTKHKQDKSNLSCYYYAEKGLINMSSQRECDRT